MLFGRGIFRIAQFITFLLLARFLSPAELGWFGILTTAISLAAVIGSLGLRQSFAYEIGQGRLTAGEAVGTALTVWPVLTALSAAVILALYARAPSGIPVGVLIGIVVGGVACSILHALLQGVFLGKGVIWVFSLSETIPRVSLMVGVIGLALFSAVTLQNALLVQVLGYALALPLMIYLSLRATQGLRIKLSRIIPLVRYGAIFAFNLFLVTLCSRLSMFVIEAYDGADAAGQFFAAVRVNEIFLEVTTAVGLVLFSHAARSADAEDAVRRGVKVGAWLFWFFLALAIPVALTAPFVLGIVVGPGYKEAIPALQVLAVGLAPTAAAKMIYPSFAGSGNPFFGTPVILLSVAVNGALALLLVPSLGATGGAVAFTVGQTFLLIGYATLCNMKYSIRFRDIFWPTWRDLSSIDVAGSIRRLKKKRTRRKDEE